MSDLNKITRFPPEPNGYLHIGHCKSIFINWEPGNTCHLRLDDTNPSAEKEEFVNNIIDDVKWLGFDPGTITYSSDHFDKLYEYAIKLILNNYAYVDFTSKDLIKFQRANGIENEFRSKSIEWNLEQFELMRKGAYKENECVLRLKIDMTNNNFTLRDPIAYRINFTPHYRLKNKWVIYPSYDYSHGPYFNHKL
jgi:glutaminyl-tRNA synthetase